MFAKGLWKDEFYIQAYELSHSGLKVYQIAAALGISLNTFKIWMTKRPTLRYAIKRAKEMRHDNSPTFADYVYKQLSPEVKEFWDMIEEAEKKHHKKDRVNAIVKQLPKRHQQRLFVHALIYANWDHSEALRMVGISKKDLDLWMERDKAFADLIDEMTWHRKNYMESHLMKLVSAGNPHAVVFVNKCLNRDRGYVDKQVVEHTGQVNHAHAHINVEELDLPLAVRRQVLDAVRKQKSLTDQTDHDDLDETLREIQAPEKEDAEVYA